MRILFVTQIVPYPPHGGVLQRGYNLLRELGKQHEVHLLAFHHPDELPMADVERSREVLGKFCSEVEYFKLWPKQSRAAKLAALASGFVYPRPFSVLAHRSSALARRIAALVSGPSAPDVVHLDTIALARFKDACGKVPTVLGHHNIESQLMARRAPHESNPLARAYVGLQARRLERYERRASTFDLNVTVSRADGDLLRKLAPGAKVAVVPNGVDTEYFYPRPGEETPALIYTGGMNMFANRDAVEWFLRDIWPSIKAAVPGVRFLAVGQAPSSGLLQAAAADTAIEAPGFVDDVRPWVARAAVYVVPLRVGGGTRLKVVDAMAQGKAIVSTSLGAEGIEGSAGRDFVLADEPARFAERVVALLRDEPARHTLGSAARALAVSRYSWPLLAQRLADAYAEVVNGKRP